MLRGKLAISTLGLAAMTACQLDVPIDPAGLVSPLNSALAGLDREIERSLADPLGTHPYPVLLGGDAERVYYTTNLGDIEFDFPGPTGDLILPGLLGPVNLYLYDIDKRQRDLAETVFLAGATQAFTSFVTDGEYLAYVRLLDPADADGTPQVVVARVEGGDHRVLFNSDGAGDRLADFNLALDDGRLAMILTDAEFESTRIRVEDLTGLQPTREIDAAFSGPIALHGDRLASVEQTSAGAFDLVLRNLQTDEVVVVARNLRTPFPSEVALFLTDNTLVWSEPSPDGLTRVLVHDVPTGLSRVWNDGVSGRLAGATDVEYLVEERVARLPQAADLINVYRFDLEGRSKRLAQFRADGLSGQTRVLGNHAAWVNPERRIVLAPLPSGDRLIFKPF